MYVNSLKFNTPVKSSNVEEGKIDSGIHFNFNSIGEWNTYKLNKGHVKVFIKKVSTITHQQEYSIIDIIKNKPHDELIIKELKFNESEKNESWTELEIKTNLAPLKYYHNYIKKTITSKPSKNCFYAFLIKRRKIS